MSIKKASLVLCSIFLMVLLAAFSVSAAPCIDTDGDGYGTGADLSECPGVGAIVVADCDDADPNVYPGATEICDGKDSDCDGNQSLVDKDNDGDGVVWCAGDCDDFDDTRFPGNAEQRGNWC